MSDSETALDYEINLNKKQWAEFTRALDQPVRNIPPLERLLCEQSVLDVRKDQ